MSRGDGSTDGSRTVTTRFVWVPHGPAAGWLLLHRTVADHGAGDTTDEFWRSEEISPEAATAGAFQDADAEWRRIVTGEPVPFLLWPFFLAAVTDRELPAVREQILRSLIRPLADISAELVAGPGGPAVITPRVTLAGDPFGPAAADLDLGDDWETSSLDPEGRRADLLTAVDRRIRVAGVRAPATPDTVTINRFVARPGMSRTGLDEVLARQDLRQALADLLAAPADQALREALTADLRSHGFPFAAEPLHLTGLPRAGLLGRLVLLCHADAPVNRIATLPACDDALRRTAGLTAALAAYVTPLDPATRTDEPAREALRAALSELPDEWDPPYEQGAGLAPPAWDEITVLTAPDGVPAGGVPAPRRAVEISHVELVDSTGVQSWRIDLSAPSGYRTDTD
ncbi:hypothetical protein Asp14428_08860 [Actinoplanes sp. NBRC 14428]|uniref:Uncharacterized protein n=1 Tax=Pseudosporangium ferrugineum TaxID=439699 RepID=A0A2T0SG04_9ACTN|nr:hypothetical protein [Pseudosporangium ferrugineum]PRY32342.1 hypothetical protein CLV70_102553 [Pseudosporangium ferrugineum]BCJ49411.1 hypothetical protein Asp14428_08860 [Actinoplanes sp. NBRC 14428]